MNNYYTNLLLMTSKKADRALAFKNEFPQFLSFAIDAAREVQEKTGDMALDRLVPYLEGIEGIISPEVDLILEPILNSKNLTTTKIK